MMKKRFSSLVSSFHGSCKSKEETSSSALPPIFYISPARRRMAAAPAVVEKAGCRCVPHERRSSPAIDADDMSRARETPAYLWRKEEKWHVVLCSEELERTMLQEEEDDEHEHEEAPSSTTTELTHTRAMVLQRRNRECKRLRSRISTSSHDTTSCCFSSEDEANDEREEDDYDYDEEEEEEEEDEEYEVDETNTLLSSLSFASNSTARRPGCPASAVGVLRRLAAVPGEGKVQQESFAVVKRSSDPRGDFRRSMAEMVVEKGMHEAADLEQLLRCFLSLNSRRHHRAVVSAFSDIWQALFPHTPPHKFDQLQQVVNN